MVRARHAVDDVQAAAVANALADADDAIGDVPKASSAPPAGPAALPGTAVVRANQPSDGTPSNQPMDTYDNTHGAVDATGPCTPDRGEDGDGLGSDDDDDGREGRTDATPVDVLDVLGRRVRFVVPATEVGSENVH